MLTSQGRIIETVEAAVSTWVPETEAERNAIREQLESVLAHPLFKNSKRYPCLLRYVVEHTLMGDATHLKERTLGVEVFGRDPHYDTNLDPVVRTTAGEIRRRIAQYYHEPGHEAEIRIDLPSGSYVPEFRIPIGRAAAVPVGLEKRTWPRYAALSMAALAVLVATAVWLRPLTKTALDRFWDPLLASDSVLLCVGPANVTTPSGETQLQSAKPVHEDADAGLSISDVQKLESQHVALSDATSLGRVAGVLEARHKSYHVRNGSFTTLQDLRDSPSVLIGAFNNYWTLRITSQLRFSFARDIAAHNCWIADRDNPAARNWQVNMLTPYSKLLEDYAIVARVRDATTERMVVVGAGISIYGTKAAGEFLSSDAYMNELVKRAPKDWQYKNVEAVIATKVINGNSGPPEVLAAHFW